MKIVLLCALSCLVLGQVPFQCPDYCQGSTTKSPDCPRAGSDGIIEVYCTGYVECIDNVAYEHNCPKGTVLQRGTWQCVLDGTSHTACDYKFTSSCDVLELAMYPDVADRCTTYVRCYGALMVGRFLCPSNLVFNEEIQACDYPFNVPPPCGTAEPTTMATKREIR